MGRDNLVLCQVNDLELQFLEDPSNKIKPGNSISIEFDTDTLQFFDIETELSLLWV